MIKIKQGKAVEECLWGWKLQFKECVMAGVRLLESM